MKEKTKQYPIFIYLVCLLLVSVLFTSVTFSRYTASKSGDVALPIGQFIYSYEIGDIPSTSFSNADYWLDSSGVQRPMNTPHTINFTLKNYESAPSGEAQRISGVPLQGTLRFYAPAEFAGNLAVQVIEIEAGGALVPCSPQYVLGNLIYELAPFDNGTEDKYAYAQPLTQRAFVSHTGTTLRTSKFTDYGEQANALDEELTLTGGLQTSSEGNVLGMVTATGQTSGAKIAVTASMRSVNYSVGVRRVRNVLGGVQSAPTAQPLYLDMQKVCPFFTVDITLPELVLQPNVKQERRYLLSFTTVEKTALSQFNEVSEMEQLFTAPASGTPAYVADGGATVLGYHFDLRVPDCTALGGTSERLATLRVQKRYDYQNGGAALTFHHVAPVSDQPGAMTTAHLVEKFFTANGSAITQDLNNIASYVGAYGTSDAHEADAHYLFLEDVADNPFYASYTNQQKSGVPDYELALPALSKSYGAQLKVLFEQAGGNV